MMLSRMAIPFSAALLALAGSAPVMTTPALAQDSTMVVNIASAPSTLDPAWGCGLWDIGFAQNFYVRLTQYGTKPGPDGTTQYDPGNIVPYFAESWTISEDGKTYTFKLHDGWKFPSGEPVDSAAVKYSFERALEMNGCGAYFLLDGFYTPPLISSIETPDPLTVVFNLAHPDKNVLQNWAQPAASIVDKTVIEANGGVEAGKPSEYMSSHAAGSGPFLLESYVPNQSAVLVANPTFGGEAPGADRIEVNWISSAPTLLLQARTGEADVTLGLSKQAAHSLIDNPEVKVIANSVSISQQVLLPNKKAPWDNPKIREAVTYAVPYEDILQKVAFGWGTLFYGAIMPTMPEFNAELSPPRTYDLEKAKALVAESGLETPIPVELTILEGDAVQTQIATVLQATWKEIGIDVSIRVVPAAEFQDLAEGHKAQTLLRLDGPGVIEAGYFLGYDMVCDLGFNLTEVCIPEADEMLAEARQANDADRRQELFDEITKLWVAASPKIFLFEDQFVSVLNKDVTSYFFEHEMDFKTWSKK
jgi:peptide/nickel transport system substrate-binding protein